MDCEGAEFGLLKPNKCNNLNKADILVEIHEFVAAGMGSRLKGHTENLPKCMLDFSGKTLIERQLLSYKECGLNNISIITDLKFPFV